MATPEELLAKLEERFILGEISEASYHELKAKLEAMLADGGARRMKISPGSTRQNSIGRRRHLTPDPWQTLKPITGAAPYDHI
jgi:hypothetical protein